MKLNANCSKSDENNEFKVVLLGVSGVGKTSLITRYVDERFTEKVKSTIGMAFVSKAICVGGKSIRLHIWDTSGQERYHSLAPMYYRGAHAAIIVYDIENESSYIRGQAWISTLHKLSNPPRVIGLAANKCEPLKKLAIDVEKVSHYAIENNLIFMETSAKTGLNVKEIFLEVAERLSREYRFNCSSTNVEKIKLNNDRNENTKKKCCS